MSYNSRDLPLTDDRLSGVQRVKVDVDQTHFWSGRGYRTFKELNILEGTSYTIRVVNPQDSILNYLSLALDLGSVRMATLAGSTPAGTWAETLPVFKTNNMTVGPNLLLDRAATVVLTAGGTVTGGTTLDVVRLTTGTGQGNRKVATVGAAVSDQRGIAPGTYYFQLTNTGTGAATGTFHASWEERGPP